MTLKNAFKAAQQALSSAKVITLPRPTDSLWIVTDAAVKCAGIGATMYTMRDNNLQLAGFFNAKLKPHQIPWLPCELEALCIGSAISHFAPYIIQSKSPVQVLTDSRPCVQAYSKLCRGEFSTSSRVTTFLSTLSRYQARLNHIAGAVNLPSDFASRNPIKCPQQDCQICKFIRETDQSVIRNVSTKDVLDGISVMPFTNRPAWKTTQLECPDLRRAHSHLTQGTRPSKKETSIPDVKRYIQSVRIANDGLLVVQDHLPFRPVRDRIIIPRGIIHGLMNAIHLHFKHPTKHQQKRLVTNYFYALDIESHI